MTLLQYFLFTNIYILAFWICYRICLKNLIYFKSIRLYLNSAIALSIILPLIQFGISDIIASTDIVTISQEVPIVGYIYKYHVGESLSTTPSYFFNWSKIIQILLLSGSLATGLIYIINHFRIKSVIKKSTEYLKLKDGLKVVMSDDAAIPFIYFNRIVIPSSISEKDISQVIKHEISHHSFAHHIDNLLFSVFHVVFWANPFFHLLRKAQKLNHEFQVDDHILSTGVDPVSYKLSLIKYSVGHILFSLANGLSSTNTKTRLMMINNIHIKKGKWRLFLLVPSITILFAVFCFGTIQPDTPEVLPETKITIHQDDSLVVEFVDHNAGPQGEEVVWLKNSVIVVLMNRNSEIMIAREELELEDVEQKIISVYNRKLDEIGDLNVDDYPKETNFDIKLLVSKDRAADRDEYKKLIDNISITLGKLRDIHSIRLFNKNFSSLAPSEKSQIEELIPLRIYGISPDKLDEHTHK